jgi:hypothetical protein
MRSRVMGADHTVESPKGKAEIHMPGKGPNRLRIAASDRGEANCHASHRLAAPPFLQGSR